MGFHEKILGQSKPRRIFWVTPQCTYMTCCKKDFVLYLKICILFLVIIILHNCKDNKYINESTSCNYICMEIEKEKITNNNNKTFIQYTLVYIGPYIKLTSEAVEN